MNDKAKLKNLYFFPGMMMLTMMLSCSPPLRVTGNKHTSCKGTPQWTLITDTTGYFTGDTSLPAKYTVFTIQESKGSLMRFLDDLKNGNENKISLPAPGLTGCITFRVENSGLLSPALAAKYPELVSLKGTDIHQNSNIARIDYDGSLLRVQMTIDNNNYLIEPYQKGQNQHIYLFFDKKDSRIQTRFIKGEQ